MLSFVVFLILAIAANKSTSLVTNETVVLDSNGRVIGGSGVTLGAAPYVASLRNLNNVHFCGGAIIHNRYVLTTAQCGSGRTVNSVNVAVGTVTLSAGTIHRSSNIIICPGYDAITLLNDVALVYTATVIAMTVFVQTIPISPRVTFTDEEVRVYGWGLYTLGGSENINFLQTLSQTTVSNEECFDTMSSLNAPRVTNRKMCAYAGEGRGTCYGDEGGPVIAMIERQFEPDSAELVGLISWQVPCAAGFPDVFERVAAYRFWILSHLV